MKNIYKFTFTTGLEVVAARNLILLSDTNYPLELIAHSKEYESSDQCVSDCVRFVNSQVLQLAEGHKTVVESNPFLSGVADDLSEDSYEYQETRWSLDEIMKVHAADMTDLEVEQFPISCSIYMIKTFSGFEIEGSSVLQ